MSEIEVAVRDLEDEYADGLITAQAYSVRMEELGKLMR